MAKALKTIGMIAGAVALVASGVGAFAAAGSAAAATASTVATYAGLAAGIANVGASALYKPPPPRGSVTQTIVQSDAPQPYVMGEGLVGGVMRHRAAYGAEIDDIPNPYLAEVHVYSGAGPVNSISPRVDQVAISSWYTGFLKTKTQLGACPEAAALTPDWAGLPGWDASSRLSGQAAILWNLLFDKEGKRFASGVPNLAAYLQGVRVYDPRLDSTRPGGSGGCRLGVESTYVYSANPALHAATYAFGRYQNGVRVFGCGMPNESIDWAIVAAWANVCAANGWSIFGRIFEPGDRWANLTEIAQAGGAVPVIASGRLSFHYAAPRVALDTLTDADLAEGPMRVTAQASWRERLNSIIPKFVSPENNWELVPGSAVTVSAYVAADGELKQVEWPFNLVKQSVQAAQLAAYKIQDSRELQPIELTYGPRVRAYRPGDCVNLDHPELGLSGPAVIMKRRFDPAALTVTLTFIGETPAKHPYALGQTTTPPPPPAIGQTGEERDEVGAAVSLASAAKLLSIASDRQIIAYTSAGGPDPATQTTTFSATRQNTTATVSWSITDAAGTALTPVTSYLSSDSGDTVQMTEAQFAAARGATPGVIVTATLTDGATTLTDRISVIRVQQGGDGTSGVGPIVGYLTNESIALAADSAGTVGSFASATGTFKVFQGITDRTTSATFSIAAQTGCTVSINASTGNYTVSAMSADSASATLQAVYGGVTLQKVLTLAKSRAGATGATGAPGADGAAGANAKTLTLISDRQTIAYDAAGNPTPTTQTTSFSVNKQNSTATVSWSITDAAGTARTPVTSYLSAATGDAVTMTQAQFASARNGTAGVIVTATMSDGGSFSDRISVVRVQQGADGVDPIVGYLTNESITLAADSAGTVGSFASATGTFKVFQGITDRTTSAAFSIAAQTGCTVSINASTGNYAVSAMSADSATATLQAVYGGVTIEKRLSLAKSRAGATGAPGSTGATGPAATSAYLTNEAIALFAYANGNVVSYSPASGTFKVFAGSTDISSSFTLATLSNPQSLSVTYTGMAYSITGGFDPAENTATLTIRATGSGSYAGVTFDKIVTLSKQKGGYEIVSALPTTNLFEGRMVFLTTDDKLYRYTGSAWSRAVDGADLVADSVTTNAIAAGAVTAAEIAVTELSAITATIGLLRTATTGARTEISSNKIEVFDGANVKRVQLGIW